MISKPLKKKCWVLRKTQWHSCNSVGSRDQVLGHSQLGAHKVYVKNGYASLFVSDKFSTMKRSWKSEERCTEILFGTTMVMLVYAPDSKKSLEMYEVLREGRKGGDQEFQHCNRYRCRVGSAVHT